MYQNEKQCLSLIQKRIKFCFLNIKLLSFIFIVGLISVSANSYAAGSKLDVNFLNSSIVNQVVEKKVKGSITDSQGDPLPGVTIVVKGTTNGTSTDLDGKYFLSGVPNNATLIFSFVGMEDQEVIVANQTNINIVMKSESLGLEELVVIGYGTQKRENLTSAVSVIRKKSLADRIVESPANLLYGLASGLAVTAASGMPGSSANIQIRESSTYKQEPVVGGGNMVMVSKKPMLGEPLFVIDGTIRNADAFANMNPNDIENITVLKDAASTAIYGMKGGNGVLLVTTKQGRAGETSVNYTATFSTSKPTLLAEQLNAYEFATRTNWMHKFLGRDDDYIGMFSPDELEFYKTNSYNVLDHFWKDPTTIKHDISISGGNQDTRYFVSGSTLDNKGALGANFAKHTFLTRLDGKISDDLSFSLNVNGSKDRTLLPGEGGGDTYQGYGLIRDLIGIPAVEPGIVNGLPTSPMVSRLLDGINANNSQLEVTNIIAKGEVSYRIPWIDGLSLKGSYSYNIRNNYNRLWKSESYRYNFKAAGAHGHLYTEDLDYDGPRGHKVIIGEGRFNGENRRLQEEASRFESHQSNFSMNYENTFGKHNIAAFAGFEESAMDERNLWASGDGLIDPTNDYMDATEGSRDLTKRLMGGRVLINSAMASFISRVDYNYYQKYILGFTMRADRSYKFPKNKQVGYFPAVSLGWNIGKESFFSPLSNTVNALKLRGSYGLTGSDNTLAWQWQNNYNLSNGNFIIGQIIPPKLTPGVVPNNLITWEKNYNLNFGVDASFFNNILSFSVDGWNRKTTDILDTRLASIPTTSGAKLPAVNYASGKAWGWDVSAEHNYQFGKVKYNVGLSWGVRNSEYLIKDQAATTRDHLNEIGQPMFGKILGFVSEGIIRTQEDLDKIYAKHGDDFRILGRRPQLGDLMFKDIRGQSGAKNPDEPDGIITNDDREILSFNGRPKNNYGINLNIEYKQFALSAIAQGTYNYEGMLMNGHTGGSNKLWGDMWTPENINGDGPIPGGMPGWGLDEGVSRPSANIQESTFWLHDLSYLRMKSITLSYRITGKILQPTKTIKGIRLFVSTENLFFIYNAAKSKGIDPELGGGGSYMNYPIMKTYSGGINVTF